MTMSNLSSLTAKISKHLLPLTSEEQSLLDLYSEVRALEKLAAQARSDASKAVLAAADEEYQRKAGKDNGVDLNVSEEKIDDSVNLEMERMRKIKKKKKRNIDVGNSKGDDVGGDNDDSDVSSDDNTNEELAEKERLREMKLNQLRDDVQEGLKEEQKNEETLLKQEERRNEFLRQSSDISDSGIIIKKKKRNFDSMNKEGQQEPSLLANMNHLTTPPHDFSKSLNMNRATGKQLFPDTSTPSTISWSPPDDSHAPDEGCLELELPDFYLNEAVEGKGNNTLAIKFSAPRDSRRFSFNIATKDNMNYYSVLFHFNPRQFEKGGQVVINDKQSGIWGQGINVPLSTFPLMFGEASCTLIVQINGDGFDVFMNDRHCARLEHRVPLPENSNSLMLQFPSTDDYGHTENWSVYKVWWGNKAIMASDSILHVPGVNIQSSLHDKKLFVSGLSKISTEAQIDLRRAELERAFHKYGGALGVMVICPPNCSFAFVEVESYRAAELAIKEMGSKYTVKRARRSRHEALMEQRAAAATASSTKEDSDWT